MLSFVKIPKKGSVITACLLLVFDQISKFFVLKYISVNAVVSVFPFLNLILTFNKGVTFGLLKADSFYHTACLLIAAILILFVVIVWWKRAENRIQRYATAMIISGAVGNIIDRIRFQGVVDFLDFHAFGYHWYAFNVADSAIVIGVGLLLFDNFFVGKRGSSYNH